MKALLPFFLLVAGGLQAQPTLTPPPEDLNWTRSFDERMNGADLNKPPSAIIVLLPDGKYLTYAPSDALTLRRLVDMLPKGTIKPTSRLILVRKGEGLIFGPKGLQTEDLGRYSLGRWDIVKIEDKP